MAIANFSKRRLGQDHESKEAYFVWFIRSMGDVTAHYDWRSGQVSPWRYFAKLRNTEKEVTPGQSWRPGIDHSEHGHNIHYLSIWVFGGSSSSSSFHSLMALISSPVLVSSIYPPCPLLAPHSPGQGRGGIFPTFLPRNAAWLVTTSLAGLQAPGARVRTFLAYEDFSPFHFHSYHKKS